MQNFIIYGSAAGMFFAVFPVYLSVYAYANTENKYASVNFCLYRFIRFLNINTAEESGKMQVNGKDTQLNFQTVLKDGKILLDNVCLYKIIQLSEFGVKSEVNAYAALVQNLFTTPLYKYLEGTGSRCKLRNYVILNSDHGYMRYTAKTVCVINMLAATKILLIYFMERFR